MAVGWVMAMPDVRSPLRPPPRHQPFWCEENIWFLAQHPALTACERLVIVLTGATAEVACWQQRAGAADGFVLWDYHVVLAMQAPDWQILDLDTRLGHPLPARDWLMATFPQHTRVRPAYQPRFALIPAPAYIRDFGSDRSHMRTADGGWQRPPPPWPPVTGHGLTLPALLAQARQGLSLPDLYRHFAPHGHGPTADIP
jgi:hypothetical protein